MGDRIINHYRGVPARVSQAPLASDRSDQGQMTLDFAIGMSLFLLVLLAMLIFAAGMLEPFNHGSQANIGTADRVADSLSEGKLGDPATPHILNTTCTTAFFDDSTPANCRYSGSNLTSRVGVNHWQNVNVTIHTDFTSTPGMEVLCWKDSTSQIVERGAGDCTVPFTIGPQAPPNSGSTVTARRIVTIESINATMRVEVW